MTTEQRDALTAAGWTVRFELPPSGRGLYHGRHVDGRSIVPTTTEEEALLRVVSSDNVAFYTEANARLRRILDTEEE